MASRLAKAMKTASVTAPRLWSTRPRTWQSTTPKTEPIKKALQQQARRTDPASSFNSFRQRNSSSATELRPQRRPTRGNPDDIAPDIGPRIGDGDAACRWGAGPGEIAPFQPGRNVRYR